MEYESKAELEIEWVHPAEPFYREVDHGKVVVVSFTLDMDFRSWGLKEVNVVPSGTVTIPLFVRDYATVEDNEGTEREVVVSVDLAKCKVAYERGEGSGRVTVTVFRLRLTPEWVADYRFCEIVAVR